MILIRRYLARAITGAVVFVLAGFLGLFAFFDFVNELDDLGRGVYQLQHAVAVVLLGLPSRIYELMPVAALIGLAADEASLQSCRSIHPCSGVYHPGRPLGNNENGSCRPDGGGRDTAGEQHGASLGIPGDRLQRARG